MRNEECGVRNEEFRNEELRVENFRFAYDFWNKKRLTFESQPFLFVGIEIIFRWR